MFPKLERRKDVFCLHHSYTHFLEQSPLVGTFISQPFFYSLLLSVFCTLTGFIRRPGQELFVIGSNASASIKVVTQEVICGEL